MKENNWKDNITKQVKNAYMKKEIYIPEHWTGTKEEWVDKIIKGLLKWIEEERNERNHRRKHT